MSIFQYGSVSKKTTLTNESRHFFKFMKYVLRMTQKVLEIVNRVPNNKINFHNTPSILSVVTATHIGVYIGVKCDK